VPHTRAGHAHAVAEYERHVVEAEKSFRKADADWRKCPVGSPCQAEAFIRSLQHFVEREVAASCRDDARLTTAQVDVAARAAAQGLDESAALMDVETADPVKVTKWLNGELAPAKGAELDQAQALAALRFVQDKALLQPQYVNLSPADQADADQQLVQQRGLSPITHRLLVRRAAGDWSRLLSSVHGMP
jgi:hypothetical protein